MNLSIDNKLAIVCGLSCVAVLLMILCIYKSSESEQYALSYPFSPINASQVVPWDAASVYSISGDKFDLCDTNDATAQCA